MSSPELLRDPPMFKRRTTHGSEQPLVQNTAVTNVLKTDSEVPNARARRRRLPEAAQPSRTRRGIDRDHAYAGGDAHAATGEKVTSLQIYRLVCRTAIRSCDSVKPRREPAGAAFLAAGKFRTAPQRKDGQPCATLEGQP